MFDGQMPYEFTPLSSPKMGNSMGADPVLCKPTANINFIHDINTETISEYVPVPAGVCVCMCHFVCKCFISDSYSYTNAIAHTSWTFRRTGIYERESTNMRMNNSINNNNKTFRFLLSEAFYEKFFFF